MYIERDNNGNMKLNAEVQKNARFLQLRQIDEQIRDLMKTREKEIARIKQNCTLYKKDQIVELPVTINCEQYDKFIIKDVHIAGSFNNDIGMCSKYDITYIVLPIKNQLQTSENELIANDHEMTYRISEDHLQDCINVSTILGDLHC